MIPHDPNFKNLFQDFPRETLQWLFPQAEQNWGKIVSIEFTRQEPKKHHLADAGLALDLPILFHFENQQLLLWLVEFQEDKSKFSIYKLLRYTTDMMEAHPCAQVVPTVLFTDRKKWRKTVPLELHTQINDRVFLHFEYVFHKLFDLNARDYYNMDNPVVKILLPKMQYEKHERIEVIRQAYKGLFQLATRGLFDKYVDFIDVYSEISDQEQQQLYETIIQHKETAMLAQYIRERGRQEGRKEGMQKGRQEGRQETVIALVRNAGKKGLSDEMIAQIIDLDVNLVRQILNNEPVEIPLHLLSDS
jgi:predicted transposase/invertase (TIGR01784 family)